MFLILLFLSVCISLCLSVSLCVCLCQCVCLSLFVSVCFSLCLSSVPVSVSLSLCLSLPLCLSVSHCACLFHRVYLCCCVCLCTVYVSATVSVSATFPCIYLIVSTVPVFISRLYISTKSSLFPTPSSQLFTGLLSLVLRMGWLATLLIRWEMVSNHQTVWQLWVLALPTIYFVHQKPSGRLKTM